MKSFYGKYLGNAFGIMSSTLEAMYLLLIFFAGVNTMLIPQMFVMGNTVNFQLITLASQILHILSVAFLFLFYVKYFRKEYEEKVVKTVAIVFALITVVLSVFSYDMENLFFLTTVNGVLLEAFLFTVTIIDFYYVDDRNNPLLKVARIIMSISVIAALMLIFAAMTYYELTAAIMNLLIGKSLSVRKNYAISFIIYALSCIMQIAQFALLYVSQRLKTKYENAVVKFTN